MPSGSRQIEDGGQPTERAAQSAQDALRNRVAAILPNFWGVYPDDSGPLLICECDEPTFWVHADRVEWVKPLEVIYAEFAETDKELADVWKLEVEELFPKLQALFTLEAK